MKKIRLKKYDKYRILLTEVLPFEVPLIFSSAGLYAFLSDGVSVESKILKGILGGNEKYTIPFNYKISINSEKSRELSVVHPRVQKSFADFYEKYSDLMLSLCSRSEASLRYPSRVASHFFERSYVDVDSDDVRGVELERPVADLEFSSSYYVYKSYSFIYQFYDSFEIINLEKRFKKQMWFDISKCFYNLYTHTISWAVRDKVFSKENLGSHSFDSEFDSLMMMANYKETNGIVVGPEFSRIFAEIIFQKIDTESISSLGSGSESIQYGRDYVIKRYVDDYFIFSNSDEVLRKVFSSFTSVLSKYKLYVNDSKCVISGAPFVTNLSISKSEIGRVLRVLAGDLGIRYRGYSFNKIHALGGFDGKAYDEARSIRINSSRLAKNYINRLRDIVASNKVSFDGASKYILGCLNKLFFSIDSLGISNELNRDFYEYLHSVLMAVLEIGFYAYSMGMSVSATYKLSRLVYFSKKISLNMPAELSESVNKYASDQIIRFVNDFSIAGKGLCVESLNLMILLKDIGGNYQLNEKTIENILIPHCQKESGEIENLNYFQIITLIFYFENIPIFIGRKEKVIDYAFNKIFSTKEPLICSEISMLILDMMSCPFLEEGKKVALLTSFHSKFFGATPPANDVVFEVRNLASREWFVRWASSDDFGLVLRKKELRSPY